jgi:hypothetical protein
MLGHRVHEAEDDPDPDQHVQDGEDLAGPVVGVRSPYPTLVSVTPLIYSESRKLHPSTCR